MRVIARLNGRSVACAVALTPADKAVGLQRHAELSADEGMYFPFDSQFVQFHMGAVRFPIDIVFCSQGRVARIVEDVQPGSQERWGTRCDGVVEVRGGWCTENDVKVGSTVEIEGLKKSAAQTYDLLRTLTTAQSDEEQKPTALSALKTFEKLRNEGRLPSLRALAAKLYAIYLQNSSDAVERDSLSQIEADRIVQSWDGKALWLQVLLSLAKAGDLPGYDKDPKVYQQQFAWQLADELRQAVSAAHDFFDSHRDEFEELAPHLDTEFSSTVRSARHAHLSRNPVYAAAAQQLVVYIAPMGPSYLQAGGAIETRFYDLLDLYDSKAAAKQVEAKWCEVAEQMSFLDRDAVVRALVDSGYPDAVRLLKISQRLSEPDVRQDMKQPGAIRHTPPCRSWAGNELPADTVGVGDSADRKEWDQELGYDVSAPMLLEDRVPAIRPSASKVAGGDIFPGDRARAVEKADGLKDDQKGVCLEVQGDMIWVKFDGEPVPRWVKNDMLSQDKEKEQILQEIEQEQQQGDTGGGLAGLLGAM